MGFPSFEYFPKILTAWFFIQIGFEHPTTANPKSRKVERYTNECLLNGRNRTFFYNRRLQKLCIDAFYSILSINNFIKRKEK